MSVAYKLHYGRQPIDFTVIRRKRRTLAISVLPDTSVEVVAPVTASEADILKKVRNARAGSASKYEISGNICRGRRNGDTLLAKHTSISGDATA